MERNCSIRKTDAKENCILAGQYGDWLRADMKIVGAKVQKQEKPVEKQRVNNHQHIDMERGEGEKERLLVEKRQENVKTGGTKNLDVSSMQVRGGEGLGDDEGAHNKIEKVQGRGSRDSVWQFQVIHEGMEVGECSETQQLYREIHSEGSRGHENPQAEMDKLINIPIELSKNKSILREIQGSSLQQVRLGSKDGNIRTKKTWKRFSGKENTGMDDGRKMKLGTKQKHKKFPWQVCDEDDALNTE